MLNGLVYLDVVPSYGLAGRHGNFQPDTSGKSNGQQPVSNGTFGGRQLAPDGVTAFAIEHFTCRKITLGGSDYVCDELTRGAGGLALQHD